MPCLKMPFAGSSVGVKTTLALWLAMGAVTVKAEKFTIDPAAEPTVLLPAPEADRLKDLVGASKLQFFSSVSPDDKTILIHHAKQNALFLLDVDDKTLRPVDFPLSAYAPIAKWVWQDENTLWALAKDQANQWYKVTLHRATGQVQRQPLAFTGDPVNLSHSGRKVVLSRAVRPEEADRGSVIVLRPKHPGFTHDEQRVPVTLAATNLYLLDLDTQQERLLVQVPANVALMSFDWADDDTKLALVRGQQHQWKRGSNDPQSDDVLDARGLLAPHANPFVLTNKVDIFHLQEEVSREHVTLDADPEDGWVYTDALWSPDGEYLAVQTCEPAFPKGRQYPTYVKYGATHYRFFDAEGDYLHTLSDERISTPFAVQTFLGDHTLAIRTFDRLNTAVHTYDVEEETLKAIPTPEGMLEAIVSCHHSPRLLTTFNSFQQPWEIFSVDGEEGTAQPLTAFNEKAKKANQVRVDKVRFSLKKGVEREGFLIQPATAPFPPVNVPLCVWQEGGPTQPIHNRWCALPEATHNILPNFGIATLAVPLPGRIGFGKRFMEALSDHLNFGQIDVDEQMEIASQLLDRGYTSKDRIGICGHSYGGYFTAQCTTTYPGFYAAAHIQAGLINIISECETGFPYIHFLVGCLPKDNMKELLKDSPLQRAGNSTTPTQLFTSGNDFLPTSLSFDYHDQMQAIGKAPADVYNFLGDGHLLEQPNNQFVANQMKILWFRRYLKQSK